MTVPVRQRVLRKKSNPLALGQWQGFPGKGQQKLPFSVSEPFSGALLGEVGCEIPAPFGRIELWLADEQVRRISLSPEPLRMTRTAIPVSAEVEGLIGEIERYLVDPRPAFQWRGGPCGTLFQEQVWSAMKVIPRGEVRTYGDLARTLGSGPRAVAGACRANPWPLVNPCHRVVGSTDLGGYCGHTDGPYLEIKRWLIAHEKGS